jgi:hypothetical protein
MRLHLAETASSILPEQISRVTPTATFPMTTIDEVIRREFDGRAPDLLKLDVQGYELEVLKGAERALSAVKVLLTEVNLIDIYSGVPLLHDLVMWLSERGWVAFDICGLTRRPLDRALWQADMLFVPVNSALRADKRYA